VITFNPVIVRINPLQATPCANIRRIRSKFVAEVVVIIRERGWNEIMPTDYSPVLFEETVHLSQNETKKRSDLEVV
jgi:hypothetical protein